MASRTTLLFLTLAASAALTAAVASTTEDSSQPRPKEKPSVEELIKRLDSDEFKTREAASRALLDRDDALPALRRALRSESAEVRRRAQEILDEQEHRVLPRRLKRLLASIKNGEADLFVEQMGLLEEHLDKEVWEAILDLARRLVAKSNKANGQSISFPHVNKMREKYPQNFPARDKLDSLKHLRYRRLMAQEITNREVIDQSLIVCQGRVESDQVFFHSIIFANGDVSFDGTIMNCIVVCDGSIKTRSGASASILIATGTIKADTPSASYVVEHARDVLGLIKFYDLKQSGVEAEQTKSGVVVKTVVGGKPFARAGVREGDRILAIDGTKVATLQELRRAVRRKAAANQEAVFSLERANRGKIEVTVELTD